MRDAQNESESDGMLLHAGHKRAIATIAIVSAAIIILSLQASSLRTTPLPSQELSRVDEVLSHPRLHVHPIMTGRRDSDDASSDDALIRPRIPAVPTVPARAAATVAATPQVQGERKDKESDTDHYVASDDSNQAGLIEPPPDSGALQPDNADPARSDHTLKGIDVWMDQRAPPDVCALDTGTPAKTTRRPVRILFIGDSVDRNTVVETCRSYRAISNRENDANELLVQEQLTVASDSVRGITTPWNLRAIEIIQRAAPWWQLWDVHTCTFWSDDLQRRVILGFHHHKPGVAGGYGPYHFNTRAVGAAAGFEWRDSEPPDELFMRLSKPATGVVVDIMGGMPDAVSINSAFWDLARIRLAYRRVWPFVGMNVMKKAANSVDTSAAARLARKSWLDSYGRNVSLHIRGVKRALSAVAGERGLSSYRPSLLAWRTAHRYWMAPDGGPSTASHWTRARLVPDMNKRAEHHAKLAAVELMDFFSFARRNEDGVHVQPYILAAWGAHVVNRTLHAAGCGDDSSAALLPPIPVEEVALPEQ